MSNSYATILQNLCQEYLSHRISFDDYRRRRKSLLEKIDEEFNGHLSDEDQELATPSIIQDNFGVNKIG